jgi:hypothetical protein
VRQNIPDSSLGVRGEICAVDVGSWIQGAGDGKEALWTGQLVNLLRQIVVAVAEGI